MYSIHAMPILGLREPFCSLSHAVGACVFAVLAILLVRRGRGDRERMISLAVMAFATVQTLVFSTLYHMSWPGPFREIMLRADVAGIFLLMAGCITPVHTILFQGTARSAPLILVWTLALGGMSLRTLYFDRLPNVAGILIFVVLGWGGAVTATILWQRHGWKFVRSGVLAGVAYTIGAVVLMLHRPVIVEGFIGPHELWHLAVLCGLGLHWNFVFQFAGGLQAGTEIGRFRVIARVGPPHFKVVADDLGVQLEVSGEKTVDVTDDTSKRPVNSQGEKPVKHSIAILPEPEHRRKAS